MLRPEAGYPVWPVLSHHNLFALLAQSEEVPHVQRAGAVQDKGMSLVMAACGGARSLVCTTKPRKQYLLIC